MLWVWGWHLVFRRWILIVAFGLFGGVSCNDLVIDLRDSSTGNVLFLPAAATIDTPAAIELSGSYLSSKSVGTFALGCTFTGVNGAITGASLTSPVLIDSSSDAHANLFTLSTYARIQKVILRLRKSGGPGGNMRMQIYATSGLNPTGLPLTAAVDLVISTSIGAGSNGTLVDFNLATPYEAAPGTYAVVLTPQAATLDGLNYFSWATTNSNGCTDFALYRSSADTGATWGAGTNPGFQRSYFEIQADEYASTGTASWITSGGGYLLWDMSTFTFSENPGGATGGTITYDVGAGNSSTVATYSSTGLTLAQVRALTDLTGDYFYVRATLSVASSTSDRALLGSGSIVAR